MCRSWAYLLNGKASLLLTFLAGGVLIKKLHTVMDMVHARWIKSCIISEKFSGSPANRRIYNFPLSFFFAQSNIYVIKITDGDVALSVPAHIFACIFVRLMMLLRGSIEQLVSDALAIPSKLANR